MKRIKRCKCSVVCPPVKKKKPTCQNVLSLAERRRLKDILRRLALVLPSTILHQNADNIKSLQRQLIRLSHLFEQSKLCQRNKMQVKTLVDLFIIILRSLPVATMDIIIHIEQMITQLTLTVQLLQNTVTQINNIMTFITNIENIMNTILNTPGAPGAPGPQGPQGPQGIPGLNGIFSPVYANLYDNADQELVGNQPVRFNQFNQPGSVKFGGITTTATSLTVPVAGDYAVLWETLFLPNPAEQHCAFGIFVNGTLRDATRSGLAVFTDQQVSSVGSVAIVTLAAGDVVELRALIPPTSTQTMIHLSARIQYPPFGGVADQPVNSASLRIFKLGPS